MSKKLETTKIAIFQKKEIRKSIHNNEWWFVIEDVIAALTDSVQPKGYIKDMRRRDKELHSTETRARDAAHRSPRSLRKSRNTTTHSGQHKGSPAPWLQDRPHNSQCTRSGAPGRPWNRNRFQALRQASHRPSCIPPASAPSHTSAPCRPDDPTGSESPGPASIQGFS